MQFDCFDFVFLSSNFGYSYPMRIDSPVRITVGSYVVQNLESLNRWLDL